VAWLAPPFFLIIGGGLIVLWLRRIKKQNKPEPTVILSEAVQKRVDRELKDI